MEESTVVLYYPILPSVRSSPRARLPLTPLSAAWICRVRCTPATIVSEICHLREIVASHAGAERRRMHYPDPATVYRHSFGECQGLRDRGGGRRQHGRYRGPPARVQ